MLDGFLWALVAALVLGCIGWVIKAPARRQNRKITDAATHGLIVAGHRGYTIRLLDESGEEIGVLPHWNFTPRTYRAGSPFTYASAAYEVVSVQDDYPAASGTLVLSRASE